MFIRGGAWRERGNRFTKPSTGLCSRLCARHAKKRGCFSASWAPGSDGPSASSAMWSLACAASTCCRPANGVPPAVYLSRGLQPIWMRPSASSQRCASHSNRAPKRRPKSPALSRGGPVAWRRRQSTLDAARCQRYWRHAAWTATSWTSEFPVRHRPIKQNQPRKNRGCWGDGFIGLFFNWNMSLTDNAFLNAGLLDGCQQTPARKAVVAPESRRSHRQPSDPTAE